MVGLEGVVMIVQELLYFVTTAEHLSFTSAANQLFITQSGLSKHISKMEAELGVRLFERDRRTVKLTPVGESFLSSARNFLMECNQLKMKDGVVAEQKRGRVSVGISCHYGHYGHRYITHLLRMIGAQPGQFELNVVTKNITELRQSLSDEELDLVISTGSVAPSDVEFEHRKMMSRRRKVILSERHPLASAEQIKVSELKDEVFAMVSRADTPMAFDMVITLCNCVGFYPKIGKQTNNFDTLYMLVEANQMVAISCVDPDLDTCPRLRAVPIDESEIPEGSYLNNLQGDLYVSWRKGSQNPVVTKICELLKE